MSNLKLTKRGRATRFTYDDDENAVPIEPTPENLNLMMDGMFQRVLELEDDKRQALAVLKKIAKAAPNVMTKTTSAWARTVLNDLSVPAEYRLVSNRKPVSYVAPDMSYSRLRDMKEYIQKTVGVTIDIELRKGGGWRKVPDDV